MDIELFLILSTAYEEVRLPSPSEQYVPNKRRQYLKRGIETYFEKQGYTYREETHEWTAEAHAAEIAQRRSQGARDGWEIRRGKQGKAEGTK